MIGERQECLDTVERYRAAGVSHFIFMLFSPYSADEVQAFAEDPERLARFAREAKLLASLNHPTVAAIYGIHEVGGTHFLALELEFL